MAAPATHFTVFWNAALLHNAMSVEPIPLCLFRRVSGNTCTSQVSPCSVALSTQASSALPKCLADTQWRASIRPHHSLLYLSLMSN